MPHEEIKFDTKTSDEDLVNTIESWVKESKSFHDQMLTQQNKAVKYYHGNQTDRDRIPAFNSDTVFNRIFEGTETLIPIITGNAHQFIAVPGEDSEVSLERAKKLQKVLVKKYEDLEVQAKLETVSRDMILKRFGVIKWFWDHKTDDVGCKAIDPRLILIPKYRMDANELPYVIELQEYDKDEIEEFFPDTDPDDLVTGRKIEDFQTTTGDEKGIYQIMEVSTREFKVWRQDDTILKKKANPYWDWEGVEEETKVRTPNGKIKTETHKRLMNFLDRPRINYVLFTPFTTGDAPVAETSVAEIAMPIQDDINNQKRRIANNLNKMGNGQVYVDSDAIEEEKIEQITSEPGLVLYGKNLASENRIRREPGVQLPGAHFSNLQDSIAAFDNVFGVSAALRGTDQSETLGGQILNKQQSLSRVEQFTRILNRGVARLADGFAQMMKMYYTEEQVVKILGRDGSIEFLKFTQNDIDDGAVIEVKSGTPVILDPVQRRNQAIQLWQLGAIDPETLFEQLEFPDPQASAQKLFAWKGGELLLESQIRQQEQAAGAQAQAQAQAQAEQGGEEEEAERGVENPNNVIQRAEQGLQGGGQAPIQNTPNGGQRGARQ